MGLMQQLLLLLLPLLASGLPDLGLNPVVIVPGLGGSVLRATLQGRPRTRDCRTDSEEYTIFVQEKQLFRFSCFIENLALHPDPSAPSTSVSFGDGGAFARHETLA